MGSRIPEEVVEQVRLKNDIVDTIGEYVQLKKQGRNYFGLCPFHGEKSPSFSVSPDKQIYHCFGCGAGGNVFNFLMKMEGVSFTESVVRLAEKSSIELPDEINVSTEQGTGSKHQFLYDIHEELAKLYHYILVNTEEGQIALDYLEQRGTTKEAIEHFQIGYAPDSWEMAVNFLRNKGYTVDQLEQAGVVVKSERDGKLFDRFRNRLMIPLSDIHGRTIAFSGRAMDDQNPKYLNTPETSIFIKGEQLYHFHEARKTVRSENDILIMEGYFDVISAWQSGIHNCVATMGTSLTPIHIKMIGRMVQNVSLCFDGDAPGREATKKAAEVFTQANFQVSIIDLPNALDPDEFIRSFPQSEITKKIRDLRKTYTSFMLDYLKSERNLSNDSERVEYIHLAIKEIAKLQSSIEIEHHIKKIADDFQISIESLKKELGQYNQNLTRRENFQQRAEKKNVIVTAPNKKFTNFEQAQRRLLAYMLRDEEVFYRAHKELGEMFPIEAYSEIMIHLLAFYGEGNEPNVSKFLEFLPDETLRSLVTELTYIQLSPNVSTEEIKDYISLIRKYPLEKEKKDKELLLKKAVEEGNIEEAQNLFNVIGELRKLLKN